ncbi:MAG: hypothetical protein IT258_13225 [Saprospiraceae bacterium]|nr:hypothetical protein [Saprospiraceae bacterium]
MKSKILVLLTSFFLFSSCSAIQDFLENNGNRTVALINDAIDKVTSQSASWQTTLTELESKLIKDTQSTVRTEVSNLADRTVAVAGTEFRCNSDFLGNRVVQELERIKARYCGKTVPERVPAICQVVPSAVDMSLEPGRRGQIDITGYDFDNQPNLRLYLVAGGLKMDVSASLNKLSHYQMVINLGQNGVLLNENSTNLMLEYNGKELSSIPITQPIIPDCIVEERVIPMSEVTFMPVHTRGDKEFEGHGPQVASNVEVYPKGNTLEAHIYMKAEETKSDWTTAEGHLQQTMWTAPADRMILEVTSDGSSVISYLDSNHADDYFEQGSGELVKRFVFVGDTDDKDAGVRTKVTVYFNDIRVKLKQIGNCKN